MDINLSISAAPSIATNWLVVAVYEANPDGSMGPLLSSQSFAAPHTAAFNCTFVGMADQVDVVVIYENTTSAVGGTIRHQFIYNPSFSNATIKDDVFLTVGITPGFTAGQTSFTPADNSWDGWDYEIELRGFGQFQRGSEVTILTAPHYGFQTTISGYTFQPGEIYIVRFKPQISIITPSTPSGGTKLFQSVKVLTTDTALLNTDMGNAIYLEGASSVINITLPNITTVNANAILPIISQGGSHVLANLKAFGTDAIKWLAGLTNTLRLGQSEGLWAFKWVDPNNAGNFHWKIINVTGEGMRNVGQFVSSYSLPAGVDPVNLLFCNGALVSRTTYARLWTWVQTLDSSMIVTDAAWGTGNNSVKFSSGDGSTTFRLPRLFDYGFLKAVDGVARKAATYEADSVGNIVGATLRINKGYAYTGGPNNNTDIGNGDPNNRNTVDMANVNITTGNVTKPQNTGVYLLIRI